MKLTKFHFFVPMKGSYIINTKTTIHRTRTDIFSHLKIVSNNFSKIIFWSESVNGMEKFWKWKSVKQHLETCLTTHRTLGMCHINFEWVLSFKIFFQFSIPLTLSDEKKKFFVFPEHLIGWFWKLYSGCFTVNWGTSGLFCLILSESKIVWQSSIFSNVFLFIGNNSLKRFCDDCTQMFDTYGDYAQPCDDVLFIFFAFEFLLIAQNYMQTWVGLLCRALFLTVVGIYLPFVTVVFCSQVLAMCVFCGTLLFLYRRIRDFLLWMSDMRNLLCLVMCIVNAPHEGSASNLMDWYD